MYIYIDMYVHKYKYTFIYDYIHIQHQKYTKQGTSNLAVEGANSKEQITPHHKSSGNDKVGSQIYTHVPTHTHIGLRVLLLKELQQEQIAPHHKSSGNDKVGSQIHIRIQIHTRRHQESCY